MMLNGYNPGDGWSRLEFSSMCITNDQQVPSASNMRGISRYCSAMSNAVFRFSRGLSYEEKRQLVIIKQVSTNFLRSVTSRSRRFVATIMTPPIRRRPFRCQDFTARALFDANHFGASRFSDRTR